MAKTVEQKIDSVLEKEHLLKLPPKHAQAVLMLAQGQTQKDVADKLKVHHNTIWRWLQKNDFSDLVAHAREVMFETTMNMVNQQAMEMVSVLSNIASQDPNSRERVSAAGKILDIQMKGRELEVDERLEQLQGQIATLIQEIQSIKGNENGRQPIETEAIALYD